MTSYPPPPAYQGQPDVPAGEPPLDQPYYGAPFSAAIRRFFAKYATFSGRASRSEFWWWYLVSAVISIVLRSVTNAVGGSTMMGSMHMTAGGAVMLAITGIWSLAILIPSLAIFWRRLHDTNRSGGWFFLGFIPLVGIIILIVWLAGGPKAEGRRFDTN